MGNDEVETYRRSREPGNTRERTVALVAATVGALSLAWILASAWVGFRDGVLAELRDCASRTELLSARLEKYYSDRDPWIERLKVLEQRSEQRGDRMQIAFDRIRDLELGGSKRP